MDNAIIIPPFPNMEEQPPSPYQQLLDHGFQIIDQPVLDLEECAGAISGLWDWLESLNRGLRRDAPETWTSKTWPKNIHGIIEYPSVAHTLPVWQIRCNAKVIAPFATLWKTSPENLMVSFDRACIHRPSKHKKPQGSWLHIDQGPALRGPTCYQGFVTLADMPKEGGTLTIVPDSQKYHDEFFQVFPERLYLLRKNKNKKTGLVEERKADNRENWLRFTEEELKWFTDKGLKPIRIEAKAGQLVLWDSRCIHQGTYALPGYEHLWRYVVYVCYKPKPKAQGAASKKALDRVLGKKRKAFEEGRTTSHWPVPEPLRKRGKEEWLGTKNFAIMPQFSKGQQPEPATSLKIRTLAQLMAVSPLGPSLAGF